MDKLYDLERELKGKRKGGTIEDWHFSTAVTPVEGTGQICFGRVVGDNVHGTIGMFRTSEIITHHKEENILETRNTYYMLGEPAKPKAPLTSKEQQELDEAVELLRSLI